MVIVDSKHFPILKRGHSKKHPCAATAEGCGGRNSEHPENHEFGSRLNATLAWAEERDIPVFVL